MQITTNEQTAQTPSPSQGGGSPRSGGEGSSRIAATFARLKREGRTALMPYLTVGYPDIETTSAAVPAMVRAGADLIEIGMPFSDPLMDGPTIQRTNQIAIARGFKGSMMFDTAREIREMGIETPLILMGSFNPIQRYGTDRFVAECAAAGIDGLIVPDLPSWAETMPPDPTVYATLGTVFNRRAELDCGHDLFAAILAGLRDEPINLVMTVGRNVDPARFGPQPAHVHIEHYIPQSLLLPRCDLVVTHGGYNTVMAALDHGLPLVLLPIGADQPYNSLRCSALGVGLPLAPGDRTPAAIRAAVRTVLSDLSYRRNAVQLREELRAMPGPETAVALVERLVADASDR